MTEFYTFSGLSYTPTAQHPVGGVIATSGDFSRFVIGNELNNSNAGIAYQYENNSSVLPNLFGAAGSYYGYRVAINNIGTRFAVASKNTNNTGSVNIYDFPNGAFGTISNPNPNVADDLFGNQLSFNKLGTIIAIGAKNFDANTNTNTGMIQVYKLDNFNNWVNFGSAIYGEDGDELHSVKLSEDGLTMVVGAYLGNNGAVSDTGTVKVYHYYTASSSWQQRGQTLYGTAAQIKAGKSVAISGDGNRIAFASELYDSDPNSATTEGIVYVYDFVSPAWVLFKTIIGEVDREIGQFVSMTSDGTKLAVSTGSTLPPLSVQVYELKTVEVAKNYPTCLEGVKPNCNVVKSEIEIKSAISQSDYISRLKSKCPDQTKDGMYFSHAGGSGIVCAGAD